MYCRNCGEKLEDNESFCRSCGTEVRREMVSYTTEQMMRDEGIKDISDIVGVGNTGSKMDVFSGIVVLFVGLIFLSGCLCFFAIGGEGKIIIIPFIICGLSVLVNGIGMVLRGLALNKRKINLTKMSDYIYTFGFLLFWFGFLLFFDYQALKAWDNGGNQMFFFSIIFWVVGLSILFNTFKK